MNTVAFIALIDGLIGLTIRLIDGVKDDPTTPEELAQRLAELRPKLVETHRLVMAWMQKP
jgi:hypothetical protein